MKKNIFLLFGLLFLVSISFAQEGVQNEEGEPGFVDENDGLPPLPEQVQEEFDSHSEIPEDFDDSNVLVLTESTFDDVIKQNPFILVEFYAPWCGHCKHLAPHYARAATLLKTRENPIPLAKVDATAETKLAEKYEVQGYPTLKFFINGEPIDYTGGRTDAEIITWIDRKTGPLVKEVLTAEDLEKITSNYDVVVVLFADGADSEANAVLKKVATLYEDVQFVLALGEGLRASNKVEAVNSIVLFKKFDEGRNDCHCEVNEENVKNFIDRNEFPTIIPFNDKAAEKIFGEGETTLFLFVGKENEKTTLAKAALRESAEKLKGKILLSVSDFSEELGQRLAEYIGINEDECPLFKIISPVGESGEVKKYNYDGELTAEGLVKFYQDFSSGNLQPFYKSEAIPEANDEPVKVVVGKSFQSIVLDETKDVIIEFYAPWCGHCKQLAPIYETVAKKMAVNPNIVVAKCDATANEIEGVAIEGFPTLKFYPAKNKVAVDYDGERTEESLLSFIKNHSSLPWIDVPQREEL